jgi:hypothetical protein
MTSEANFSGMSSRAVPDPYTTLYGFIERYMPLTAAEKTALAELDAFRSYRKGDVVVAAGRAVSEDYFVLKGCLRSYRVVDEVEINTAFHTDLEAIIIPLQAGTRIAMHSVACLEDSIVGIGTPEMERKMFAAFPRFETLCRIFSEELLMKSHATLADFIASSPEERYAALVRDRPDLVQRVPQYHLATWLGITPQSLSRIRKRTAGLKAAAS